MPARRRYHHGDLRNALIATAIELVDELGPEAVSLREVARRVGVNHRAAYRHFDSKSALTAAIAEQGFTTLAEALETSWAKSARKPARARVEAMMDTYLRFALASPARYRIIFGRRVNEHGEFPALEPLAARAFVALMRAMGSLKKRRVSQQTLRDGVFALWSMAHGYLRLLWVRRIAARPARQAAHFRALAAPLLDGWAR